MIAAQQRRHPEIVVTDQKGPRGAGEFLRNQILTQGIALPEQIAWLLEPDWWEKVLSAAEDLQLVIR